MDLFNNNIGLVMNVSGLSESQIAADVETLVTGGACRYLYPIWPPKYSPDGSGTIINANGDPDFWGAGGTIDKSTATHGITNLTHIIPTNQ